MSLCNSARVVSTSFICADINSYLSLTSLYSSIAETLTLPSDRILVFISARLFLASAGLSIATPIFSASLRVS